MQQTHHANGTTPSPPMLLRPSEAAEILAISERTLWAMTKRGEIPAVRLGRSVRYNPATLQQYIADSEAGGDGSTSD